jgi:hypothetical protein
MKTTILFCALFIHFLPVSGQPDKELRQRLDSVLYYTQQGRYEKVLDYTYPKMFMIATRKQMLDAMNSMLDDEDMRIRLDSVILDSIYPLFVVKEDIYCKVTHRMQMRMQFKETLDTADGTENGDELAILLKEQMEATATRYDKKNNTIVVSMEAAMMAIKPRSYGQWYFINLASDKKAMLRKILGDAVVEKLEPF